MALCSLPNVIRHRHSLFSSSRHCYRPAWTLAGELRGESKSPRDLTSTRCTFNISDRPWLDQKTSAPWHAACTVCNKKRDVRISGWCVTGHVISNLDSSHFTSQTTSQTAIHCHSNAIHVLFGYFWRSAYVCEVDMQAPLFLLTYGVVGRCS